VSPLETTELFHLGGVAISRAVATTWGIMALLAVVSVIVTRRLRIVPTRWQTVLELFVQAIEKTIGEITSHPPKLFLPFLGSLFLFLVAANLASIVPGVYSPTAQVETAAALAAVVFVAVHYFGIRISGVRGHLRTYAEPSILTLPLNVIGELTRTFALMVRLFGNIMSGQFLVVVILAVVGLLVPVPLMALGIVIGIIQAYIFTVLAAVFIAAGLADRPAKETP